MSDPAIDAATRAWTERYPMGVVNLDLSVEEDGVGAFVIASAREALKPLRELHRSTVFETPGDRWLGCNECGQDWPCSTAELAYTAEELSR